MILKEQASIEAAVQLADALTMGWVSRAHAVQTGVKARPVYYVADDEGLEQLHQWGQRNVRVEYSASHNTVTLTDGRRLPVISEAFWKRRLGLPALPPLIRPLVRDDSARNQPVVGWWEFGHSIANAVPPNGFEMTKELAWRVCYVGMPSDATPPIGAIYVQTKWVARKDGFIAYSKVSGRDAARNVRNQIRRDRQRSGPVNIVGV